MIELELARGWMRNACHLMGAAIGMGFGWYWLGNAGVGLAALYAAASWETRPQRSAGSCSGGAKTMLRVSLARLHGLWLLPGAVVIQQYGEPVEWVFRDELTVADYRDLRRRLKAQLQGLL